MGDFKNAFIEGMGKSLAYGVGGIIFLLMIVLLGATGLLTANRNPKLREFFSKENH
jgi:hypothetical protein